MDYLNFAAARAATPRAAGQIFGPDSRHRPQARRFLGRKFAFIRESAAPNSRSEQHLQTSQLCGKKCRTGHPDFQLIKLFWGFGCIICCMGWPREI